MKKLAGTVAFIFVMFLWAGSSSVQGGGLQSSYLILCYHDIPVHVWEDEYGVDRSSFVEQIEYLRASGYNFISFDDVKTANKGEKQLPEKSVLLTFDDAFLSFYEFVFPLLQMYGYPSVLAVVTGWVDSPPSEYEGEVEFMNWEQLKEVADDPLVEIASHTHDLHRGIIYNPQENTGPAATSRIYDVEAGVYEDEAAYRERLRDDFSTSKNIMKEKLGVDARIMVWPFGAYNQICIEEAESAGFEAMFALENRLARMEDMSVKHRYILTGNPSIRLFISEIKRLERGPVFPEQQRVIHTDLDLLYDSDPVQLQANLDAFIERVYTIRPRAVYLQAFADDAGDGNISSVYFPNRVLPVKADLFSYVTNQLVIRGIPVYAWMPMLSIVLPDEEQNEALRVRELRDGKILPSSSWYRRLSPSSPEARRIIAKLYEDMAVNARISGVIFNDDGYLNDYEDYHPDALIKYRKHVSSHLTPYEYLSSEQKRKWTGIKTEALIELTEELKTAVLRHRPEARLARTLYANTLMMPHSEEWFAQNYAASLENYDYAVLMAYPLMEKVRNPVNWLKRMVEEARKYPDGLEKTVFKIQSYDWNRGRWIDAGTLDKWLRTLAAAGAMHLAYYPDNCIDNKPEERMIRKMISTEVFPFERK